MLPCAWTDGRGNNGPKSLGQITGGRASTGNEDPVTTLPNVTSGVSSLHATMGPLSCAGVCVARRPTGARAW